MLFLFLVRRYSYFNRSTLTQTAHSEVQNGFRGHAFCELSALRPMTRALLVAQRGPEPE